MIIRARVTVGLIAITVHLVKDHVIRPEDVLIKCTGIPKTEDGAIIIASIYCKSMYYALRIGTRLRLLMPYVLLMIPVIHIIAFYQLAVEELLI